MFLVSSCSCFCPILWSHVLSREWGCSWQAMLLQNLRWSTSILPNKLRLILEFWRYFMSLISLTNIVLIQRGVVSSYWYRTPLLSTWAGFRRGPAIPVASQRYGSRYLAHGIYSCAKMAVILQTLFFEHIFLKDDTSSLVDFLLNFVSIGLVDSCATCFL